MEEFRQFRVFEEEGEADALKATLEEAGIAVLKEKVTNYLDPVIAGSLNSRQQFILKLMEKDFEKAEGLFDQMAQKDLDSIPEDYHLFSFTDEELMDIVDHQNEWSKIDFHLALRILKERGKEVGEAYMAKKKEENLEAQKASQKVSFLTILSGYILFISAILSIMYEAPLLLIAIAWPIVLGIFLWTSKKTLPDGSRYYFYDKSSRNHGLVLFILGSIALFGPTFYFLSLIY